MNHSILSPSYVRQDNRGVFQEIINSGAWEAVITGKMNENSTLGGHYHKKTEIFFFILDGSAHVQTLHVTNNTRDDFSLNCNQGVIIHSYETHTITFLENSSFVMLKSKKFEEVDQDIYPFPIDG